MILSSSAGRCSAPSGAAEERYRWLGRQLTYWIVVSQRAQWKDGACAACVSALYPLHPHGPIDVLLRYVFAGGYERCPKRPSACGSNAVAGGGGNGRGGTSHECCCRHGPKVHRSGRPEERLLHLLHLLHLLRLVVVLLELLEHLALTGEMCWVLITVNRDCASTSRLNERDERC